MHALVIGLKVTRLLVSEFNCFVGSAELVSLRCSSLSLTSSLSEGHLGDSEKSISA